MNPAIFAGLLAALLASSGSARQKPDAAIGAGFIVVFVLWLVLPPALLAELSILIHALATGDFVEALWALCALVPTALMLFPWPITRNLLIPLGLVRPAWALSRLSFWVWRRDVRGGALIAMAWAAVRKQARGGELPEGLVEWMERRRYAEPRGSVRWRLGSAGIIATGLLADARGDRSQARRLLASAAELAEPAWPRRGITLGCEWLCAEAMERGAWREVEFLARTTAVASRRTRLFGAVAARLTGIAPVPSDILLQWRWLAAPQRSRTRPLLARALAAPNEPTLEPSRVPAEPPPLPGDNPLAAALILHAFNLVRDPAQLHPDDLRQLARAWDRALSDKRLERQILERGLALAAHTGDARRTLTDTVRDDLLALVRASGLDLSKLEGQRGDHSELLDRTTRQLHRELLDQLEVSAQALEARVEARRELPAIDEWQAFLAVREQYADAVALGGLELRRLAFQEVHGPVCSLAVWLWNERSERAIGNAMFQWMLAEAVIVDDAEAIRLQEKNVNCGL